MRVIAIFLFLLASAAAVEAQPRNPYYGEPPDFLGTWNNVELQRNMVSRIEIRPDYRNGVWVIVYGLHNGQPCKFGEYRGKVFLANRPKDQEEDNSAILVRVEREFVHGYVLLRFNRRGEIVSHAVLDFADRGRSYMVERFATARTRGYEGGGYPPYPPQDRDRPPYYREGY